MISDVIAHLGGTFWARVGLILFFVLFIGIVIWTLRGGRWSNHPDPTYPNVFSTVDCAGFYDVGRDVATFTTTTVVDGGTCAPPSWTARWSLHEDTLRWSAVSADDYAYVFGGEGWTKID